MVDQLIWNQLFAYVFGFVVCITISAVRVECLWRHIFSSLPEFTCGVGNASVFEWSSHVKKHFRDHFNNYGWNFLYFKWLLITIWRLWPHNFTLHILYGGSTMQEVRGYLEQILVMYKIIFVTLINYNIYFSTRN